VCTGRRSFVPTPGWTDDPAEADTSFAAGFATLVALTLRLHATFNLGVTGLCNVEGGLPAVVRLEVDGPPPWVGEAGLVETLMIVVTLGVTVMLLRRQGRTGLDRTFRTDGRMAEATA